ncbi:MAG: acyl-CoA reductase [Thermoanaerobaculia bacterium]
MPAEFSDLRDSADRAPRSRPQELEVLAGHLARRGPQAVAAIPVARRLEVWEQVIEALLEPGSPERSALLPRLLESSRLSAEGLTEALEIVLSGAAGAAAAELAQRAQSLTTAAPEMLAGVVLAGNIPGLAVQSLLPALLLGRPLLLKSASAEPWFAPALVAALVAREPALAEAYAAVTFSGADDEALMAAFGGVASLLAYGGAKAAASLAARFGERLVAHGPKASVAFVSAEVDLVGTARGLARDIALFDQRGCLSVQAIYTAGDPEELAAALAWALRLESARLPHGPIDPATAAAVQQLRAEAELRHGTRSELESELAVGTVLIERETFFRPVPGLRTVRVHDVRDLRDALPALAPWKGRLQGAALAGAAADALSASLPLLGFSRLAPPGELQSADAAWANGGIDPLEAFSVRGGRSR